MILVDTSVVIDYARGKDAELSAFLPTQSTAICGIVRAELLCGARNPAHRENLMALLAVFQYVSTPEPLWDAVGDHLGVLRMAGITVPFSDVVIGTVAIANGLELWTRDAQFQKMQNILPALKLYIEY